MRCVETHEPLFENLGAIETNALRALKFPILKIGVGNHLADLGDRLIGNRIFQKGRAKFKDQFNSRTTCCAAHSF